MENGLNGDRLEIINRKRLTMNGVETVDGFSEQQLKLTVSGVKVKITGEKIKITAFNKATGTLAADGVFTEIKYNALKVPFYKRVFK